MDGEIECCDPIIGQDNGYSIRCWQLWMWDRKLLWHRMGEYHSVWTNWNLEAGRWYHVAAVFDGTTHHLFVNGKEEGEASQGILKVSRDEPIRIGSKGDPTGSKRAFFCGAIDSVRLYDRALTEAELLALSREGKDETAMAVDAANMAPAIAGGKPSAERPEPSGSVFRHLSLAGAVFDNVSMKNATLHDINLSDAMFDDINMKNAAFHNINMSNVSISAVQLGGAKFKHIGLPPGSKEKQRPLSFEEADLNGTTISKCDLSNMRIEDCTIAGMTINGILVTDLLADHK